MKNPSLGYVLSAMFGTGLILLAWLAGGWFLRWPGAARRGRLPVI